jgi:CBS domain-containing protein
MSQQQPTMTQPGQVRDIKGPIAEKAYPKECARAEEYLQGRVWGLSDFFNSFTCKSVFLPNPLGLIVSLHRNSTVGEAWLKMTEYRILSLPILEPVTNKPLYVLSMMHILDFLITKYGKQDFSADLWAKYIEGVVGNPKTGTFGATLEELENNSRYGMDPAPAINEDQTLGDAVRLMLECRAHRVCVLNERGDLVNLLSQSRIVELISFLIGSIPKCAKPIQSLDVATTDVMCINENKTAFEAFCMMRDKKLCGLPIVGSVDNTENVLVGNISISDLKLVGFDSSYWRSLGRPLKEYLSCLHYRPEYPLRSDAFSLLREKGCPELVRVREWHTFGHVIRTLAYFKIHRIYVTDSTGAPTGIITLTDVLRELTRE